MTTKILNDNKNIYTNKCKNTGDIPTTVRTLMQFTFATMNQL